MMAQPAVSHINGLNSSDDINHNNRNKDVRQQLQQPQPNVRHIPIFVEGRDEPLINTKAQRPPCDVPGAMREQSLTTNDFPKPGSIYSRIKDIPVRAAVRQNPGRADSPSRPISINEVHTSSQNHVLPTSPGQCSGQERAFNQKQPQHDQPNVHRSNSKVHTIPIKVEHNSSQRENSRGRQLSPSRRVSHATDEVDFKQTPKSNHVVQQSLVAITKIQEIQQDVLDLMNRVEQYKGGSRRDKEYLYLDEMLTQNLLKLDTIDAEGKESIKAARKEAIKCINKCIVVLESRTEPSTSNSNRLDGVQKQAGKDDESQSHVQREVLKS